jgi:hypothetical protein
MSTQDWREQIIGATDDEPPEDGLPLLPGEAEPELTGGLPGQPAQPGAPAARTRSVACLFQRLSPTIYAVDALQLEQGDRLTQEECSQLTGLALSDDRYPYALRDLKRSLLDALWAVSRHWWVRQSDYGVRILTHLELKTYLMSTVAAQGRKWRMCSVAADAIDPTEFSPTDKRELARVRVQARLFAENAEKIIADPYEWQRTLRNRK